METCLLVPHYNPQTNLTLKQQIKADDIPKYFFFYIFIYLFIFEKIWLDILSELSAPADNSHETSNFNFSKIMF